MVNLNSAAHVFTTFLILGLLHLKGLDISKNNFDAVPPQLHYDGLEELIIDENPMSVLKSHSFSAMTSLQKLSICKMPNLGYIKEVAFAGLRNLSILHIENNPMLGKVYMVVEFYARKSHIMR